MALAGFGSVFIALGKIYHEEFKEYLYKIAKNVNVHVLWIFGQIIIIKQKTQTIHHFYVNAFLKAFLWNGWKPLILK